MSAASPDIVPTELPEAPGRTSYWGLVWKELARNRIAVAGLWAIGVLFVLAIYAPLLSLNQPFVWDAGEGRSYPFFASLFNRLLFENAVDVFFNLLMVLSPAYAAGWFLSRRRGVAPGRTLGALVAFHVALFSFSAPERFLGRENPLHRTAQVINYRAEAARLAADGKPPLAIFPPHRHGYRETDPSNGVKPPSREHWLGTDTEGRDVLARMLYGTRISMTIGVVAVFIYVSIGVALGSVAGYFGGLVDNVVSRIIEVIICFPSFFLILTLAALIQERSIFHVMFIIGITSWTGVARLIRAEFLKNKNLEYVQAARALGIPPARIIFSHILPNALSPVLVSATFGVASAILIESSLSFLGIGDLTVASWGETLNTGRLEGKLWLILAPGVAIFFVVTVFNLVGEGLRDALDPKLRS